MSPQTVSESTKSDLCNAYHAAHGPFTVSVEGQEGFIIMRPSDLDGEPPLSAAEKASLLAGYDDYLKGRVVDAREMIAAMRGTHGL